jgi:hypothetical protein
MIGLIKKCLSQIVARKRCTYSELTTMLAEAAQMVNSRPLGTLTSDPYSSQPLTPLHLMMGRATVELPEVKFDLKPSLPKRLQFVEDAKAEFWRKWIHTVFSSSWKSRTNKWRKDGRDPMIGDVVLMKEETLTSLRYRRGRITAVKQGEDDHARSVEVTYKNPNEEVFRTTWRTIQNLVLLVPADFKEEDSANEDGGQTPPEPPEPASEDKTGGQPPLEPQGPATRTRQRTRIGPT